MSNNDTRRTTGKVVRVLKDYGFISSETMPDQDLYFKTSWFQGAPPLKEGDVVTFELKTFGDDSQAYYVRRATDEIDSSDLYRRASPSAPRTYNLFKWAYLGYLPNALAALKELALDERWEFKNQPDRPLPILYSYLFHTFGRLVLQTKVVVNESVSLAAFNTGLVDSRYEPIYGLFEPNQEVRTPWQLRGFCIAGEDSNGQNLVRHFNPLPQAAHYFDQPADLLYDIRGGIPELDWNHIVIECIDRYPDEFLEDHRPTGFAVEDSSKVGEQERRAYFEKLGMAIKADKRVYRRIMNRVKDAIDLSIKRTSWNFKTAVPQYYPKVRQLQLLLPICLVSDEVVDLALAVEKTDSGNYLGHTVLTLDWAYRNARLICRPDSDWLEPHEIIEGVIDEDDT